MKEVKIYSRTGCSACATAKIYMGNKGIDFEEIAIDKDEEAMKYVVAQGVRTLPLIEIGDKQIFGFNPAEINKTINS